MALLGYCTWQLPSLAQAACNLIPGTIKNFNSTLGATNHPFAAALRLVLEDLDDQIDVYLSDLLLATSVLVGLDNEDFAIANGARARGSSVAGCQDGSLNADGDTDDAVVQF